MLEDLLQTYFGLSGPLCATDGRYTDKGHAAYQRLIRLLYAVGEVAGENVDRVVARLDQIEED